MKVSYVKAEKKIKVDFDLMEYGPYCLKLVDYTGKEMGKIEKNDMVPGKYQNSFAVSLPGYYWCKLSANGYTESKRIFVQ
jgi:hypothetical protein